MHKGEDLDFKVPLVMMRSSKGVGGTGTLLQSYGILMYVLVNYDGTSARFHIMDPLIVQCNVTIVWKHFMDNTMGPSASRWYLYGYFA